MSHIGLRIVLALCTTLSLTQGVACAQQSYPSRPLRIVIPFPPGGTLDIFTRAFGARLTELTGQQVIVDNRSGGLTVIASEIVARANPDGYTIGIMGSGHAVNPYVFKSLPYDTDKDFQPVSLAIKVPGLMTAHPALPANTIGEIIALAKASPGKYNYATPGSLTSGHLSMELIKLTAGIDITTIPYKGGGPAIIDLIGGQVQMLISGAPGVLPHIKSGKLKAIGVTDSKRTPGLPDIPTLAETGLPGFATYDWYGLFVPARTPPEVVARLQQMLAQILRQQDFSERLTVLGAEPVGGSPEEFRKFIRSEMDRWGTLARKIGLKAD
jgi:tripartite-type tricarboxylate transporter receptor subunit TctC